MRGCAGCSSSEPGTTTRSAEERPDGVGAVGQSGPVSEPTTQQNVHFQSAGREVAGYLALPEAGRGPGVIVVQEWWGLDDHLASVVDRLAAEGFVALAPDLYGGRVAHGTDDAGKMMMELPVDQAARDLGGSVDFLLAHEAVTSEQVGAIGFCMGGSFVLLLAVEQGDRVAAVVPFYGVGPAIPDTYTGLTADLQGHYGTRDDTYPVDQARAQEAQLRQESQGSVEYFYYDAGHAFLNDTNRMGSYDREAADTAWARAVDFLQSHLAETTADRSA